MKPSKPDLDKARPFRLEKRNKHAFPIQEGYIYECVGCGFEPWRHLDDTVCRNPYSDPIGIENVLIEIRDILKRMESEWTK